MLELRVRILLGHGGLSLANGVLSGRGVCDGPDHSSGRVLSSVSVCVCVCVCVCVHVSLSVIRCLYTYNEYAE